MEQDLDELNADPLITLAQVMLHSKTMTADALLQGAVGAYCKELKSSMQIAYVLPQYIAPYVEHPCGDAVQLKAGRG